MIEFKKNSLCPCCSRGQENHCMFCLDRFHKTNPITPKDAGGFGEPLDSTYGFRQ